MQCYVLCSLPIVFYGFFYIKNADMLKLNYDTTELFVFPKRRQVDAFKGLNINIDGPSAVASQPQKPSGDNSFS